MKYQILEHPSELRIRVYGKTLEELFSSAVLAMGEIMSKGVGTRNRESGKRERMQIESVDLNSLLVDFLSEILALSQINKKVYKVSSIKYQASEKGANIEVELIGHPVGHFDEDIKAVTYEDLDIKKVDGAWETMIVFDI